VYKPLDDRSWAAIETGKAKLWRSWSIGKGRDSRSESCWAWSGLRSRMERMGSMEIWVKYNRSVVGKHSTFRWDAKRLIFKTNLSWSKIVRTWQCFPGKRKEYLEMIQNSDVWNYISFGKTNLKEQKPDLDIWSKVQEEINSAISFHLPLLTRDLHSAFFFGPYSPPTIYNKITKILSNSLANLGFTNSFKFS